MLWVTYALSDQSIAVREAANAAMRQVAEHGGLGPASAGGAAGSRTGRRRPGDRLAGVGERR